MSAGPSSRSPTANQAALVVDSETRTSVSRRGTRFSEAALSAKGRLARATSVAARIDGRGMGSLS
jgi:hypothetical protein